MDCAPRLFTTCRVWTVGHQDAADLYKKSIEGESEPELRWEPVNPQQWARAYWDPPGVESNMPVIALESNRWI